MEVKNLFPDCETGAMPPFRNLCDVALFAERVSVADVTGSTVAATDKPSHYFQLDREPLPNRGARIADSRKQLLVPGWGRSQLRSHPLQPPMNSSVRSAEVWVIERKCTELHRIEGMGTLLRRLG